jgi:predicted transcriptional regulator of viral defense system
MNIYDKIYDIAADHYGLITSDEAKDIGIPIIELVKLAHRGKLKRLGHGLYRLSRYIPTSYDAYAEAVKMVGPEAYLYGESVLALHGLIPTNPLYIHVASPIRVRKKLPEHIQVIRTYIQEITVYYEGIPSQNAVNAIRACVGSIMNERLIEATREARRLGIITASEEKNLKKEFKND